MPYESMKPAGWPDLPFVISGGIPLSLSLGYAGSGRAELTEKYLLYCRAHGVFRTNLFTIPNSLTASNALTAVFDSPGWKGLRWADGGEGWHYSIDEADAKKSLWKQVESIGEPGGAANRSQPVRSDTNQTSAAAGSGR
jgi:hypothetical protein